MGGIASFVGPAIGVASSLFGGGGSGPSGAGTSVPYYIPQGLQSADKSWQAALAQLAGNNPYKTSNPAYQVQEQKIINNPYAAGAQTAANTAGQQSTAAGSELAGLAHLYGTEATGLAPTMQQILQMGMDPQNALYASTLQKINDQANVSNAQYGLTGQQAAGNVQQADQNFNMDWQNQQLGRALQGISGAQQVGGTQAGLGQAAGQAATGAAGLTAQGGALPYGQFNSNIGNILQALSGGASFGSQVNNVPQQVMSNIIPYLNYGNGATNAASGAAGVNQQANQLAGQGIGSIINGLTGLFGGGGGGGLSNFFGGGSGNPLGLSSGSNWTGNDLSALAGDFASAGGGF